MAKLENITTKKAYMPGVESSSGEEKKYKTHPLDTDDARQKHAQLMEWYHEARSQHSANRYEQSVDADFYDGLQWSTEDIQELKARGQAALVFNKTSQHVNWLLGTERRTRVDFKIHPRNDEDRRGAESKTKLLKYIGDVNKAAFHRSAAFADAVKVGIGWLEDGIRSDPFDEPLFSRYESWRNMWYDPYAKERDLSDARFVIRERWVDLDTAIAMFPDRKEALRLAAITADLFSGDQSEELQYTGFYDNQQGSNQYSQASGSAHFFDSFHVGQRRSRVKLLEFWYRVPTTETLVSSNAHSQMYPQTIEKLRDLHGKQFDSDDPVMKEAVDNGYASTYDAIRMKVHCAILTAKDLLQDKKSVYDHDRYPFTVVWGNRRDRDNAPYGIVRNMRDPQEDLNKRRSKALYILSTNRIVADEDAVEDWAELEEQAARPDSIIKKRRGAEIEFHTDTTLAAEHVKLMEQDEHFMESASGVTEDNLGQQSNAVSGKAITARQNEGSVVTAQLFDNLRYAIQLQGELQLALIEQFYDQPKILRITDDRGVPSFVRINYPEVDDQGQLSVQNPITQSKADFIVDTVDFRESVRIQMFEKLIELMGQMDSDVSLSILDLVIDMSDIAGKDEIVRRIRKLNGQVDPDSPTMDEELQKQDASDAKKQKDADELLALEKAERQADVEKQRSANVDKQMAAMAKAAEIAETLKLMPELGPAIDALINSTQAPQPPTELPQGGGLPITDEG